MSHVYCVIILMLTKCVLATPPRETSPACLTGGINFDSRPNQIGDPAIVSCLSRGGDPFPSLTWRRNGVVVASQYTEDSRLKTAQSDISWELTSEDDNAMYECTLTHPELTQPRSCSLQQAIRVRYSPIVTVNPPSLVIATGNMAVFICYAHGSPSLSFLQQWNFDGSLTVPDSDRYSSSTMTDGGILLQIKNIMESDYAVEITCKAVNTKGTTRTQVLILPPPPPSPSTITTTPQKTTTTLLHHVTITTKPEETEGTHVNTGYSTACFTSIMNSIVLFTSCFTATTHTAFYTL
ncbi:cell adhesion molecule 2-like [Saccoglossus kowalevskii]|uniref:Cell adhesion molecule 2-like n=1 Tax=Saccoglossus kowalevskii TaxID=10224 RepID=A0ABM0MX13_SACKO|nr:PREDICTED: cell adhesion molecule 2-like [Saccoglossus kowalevskii]